MPLPSNRKTLPEISTAGDEEFSRHLKDVRALLARQHRVSELIHHQRMQRRNLVEGLVRRQHLVELQGLIRRLSTPDTARVLAALDGDDRLVTWRQVEERICEDVLELLPDNMREELVGDRPLPSVRNMVSAFELNEGRLIQVAIDGRADLDRILPVWIDLVAPTHALRKWVGDHFGVDLPDPEQLSDIEASARFFFDDGGEPHVHSDFLLDTEGIGRSVAVAFVLHGNMLFSVRSVDLPVFRLQRLRARTQASHVSDGKDLLLDLYAADVEYSAEALERIYAEFEAIGRRVLDTRASDEEAGRILADIARGEDINGRIRRNVLDTRRALSFLLRGRLLSSAQQEVAQQILRDIESLDVHTSFLFGKINFLLDSTIGSINIQQNRRVARLTSISLVFAPINIVVGIGGMSEFSMMSQGLPWQAAYGAFVLAVLGLGIALYGSLRFIERGHGTRNPQQLAKYGGPS